MACHKAWTRGSAKRSPEARWRPAVTGLSMAWNVSRRGCSIRSDVRLRCSRDWRQSRLAQLACWQALANTEVVAVVDGRSVRKADLLVVLLDPRVVIDVQGRGDVLGDDAGAELSGVLRVMVRLKISRTSWGRPDRGSRGSPVRRTGDRARAGRAPGSGRTRPAGSRCRSGSRAATGLATTRSSRSHCGQSG